MKFSKRILILIALIATLLLAVFYGLFIYQESKIAGVQTDNQRSLVRGMIVPHHKLAHTIIDEAYQNISDQEYSYIVIFSPNHYFPDAPSVMTSNEIPQVAIDEVVIDALSQQFLSLLTC